MSFNNLANKTKKVVRKSKKQAEQEAAKNALQNLDVIEKMGLKKHSKKQL